MDSQLGNLHLIEPTVTMSRAACFVPPALAGSCPVRSSSAGKARERRELYAQMENGPERQKSGMNKLLAENEARTVVF